MKLAFVIPGHFFGPNRLLNSFGSKGSFFPLAVSDRSSFSIALSSPAISDASIMVGRLPVFAGLESFAFGSSSPILFRRFSNISFLLSADAPEADDSSRGVCRSVGLLGIDAGSNVAVPPAKATEGTTGYGLKATWLVSIDLIHCSILAMVA